MYEQAFPHKLFIVYQVPRHVTRVYLEIDEIHDTVRWVTSAHAYKHRRLEAWSVAMNARVGLARGSDRRQAEGELHFRAQYIRLRTRQPDTRIHTQRVSVTRDYDPDDCDLVGETDRRRRLTDLIFGTTLSNLIGSSDATAVAAGVVSHFPRPDIFSSPEELLNCSYRCAHLGERDDKTAVAHTATALCWLLTREPANQI